MNKVRKQIIELISDYMDKTLSEWCLLNWYSNEINIWEYYTYWSYADWYFETNINGYELRFQRLKDNWNWDIWYYQIEKIIWHYDITAVLKYIEGKTQNKDSIILSIYWELQRIDTYTWDYIETIFETKNKPLHLYTEQEEKELLELLLKIK